MLKQRIELSACQRASGLKLLSELTTLFLPKIIAHKVHSYKDRSLLTLHSAASKDLHPLSQAHLLMAHQQPLG